MKTKYADYSLDEIPELEETAFEFSVCRRFEDSNDVGHIGDSISFAMDVTGDFAAFD